MRPVEKGESPYTKIKAYQTAFPYLKKRLGDYCTFCEMRVNNALAVEHKESKNSGGALTDWKNLLLSCTYCNSRKGEKIKKGEADRWLWPDEHNTFLAFSYENAVPKVAEDYLPTVGEDALQKAKAVLKGLALDSHPDAVNMCVSGKNRDKRWEKRFETLNIAEDAKQAWKECKDTEFRAVEMKNIMNLAKGYGFFSVWMMVFAEEDEVKNVLIRAFAGTATDCFDEHGNPVRQIDRKLVKGVSE